MKIQRKKLMFVENVFRQLSEQRDVYEPLSLQTQLSDNLPRFPSRINRFREKYSGCPDYRTQIGKQK